MTILEAADDMGYDILCCAPDESVETLLGESLSRNVDMKNAARGG
jgi:hypothetical protein